MDDDDRAEEWQRLADDLAAAQDVDSKTSALASIQQQLQAAATTSDASAAFFISPLKPCLKSSNSHVFSLALGLVPLVVRLLDTSSPDGQRSVHAAVVHLTPPTLERAGDARERVREAALKALIDIGKVALVGAPPALSASRGSSGDTPLSLYESLITAHGLLAKSPRIREQACRLLAALRSHSSTRFPIKPFLPGLVDLLADADGACREAARMTLVTLFASASAPAKADLKREMEVKGVRKALADGILRDVIGGGGATIDAADEHPAPTTAASATPATAAAPSAPAQTVAAAPVPPVYLASPRDLSSTLASLLPYFDGKETEHNWAKREASIIKLRGILKSQPNHQLAEAFAAETRALAEPIMKAVASLRTTLAMHGIALIAELAAGLPHPTYSLPEAAIDVLLPGLLRMAGFTKRLVATSSQIAAGELLRHVAYRPKFMGWLWAGMADKTVQTRVAMVEHLHTLLVCVRPVGLLEQHDGVSIMCQLLSKGLADQNPEVRQKAREAFYVFRRVWAQQAEGIVEKLDPAIKKQVMAGMAAAEAAHVGGSAVISSPRKAAAPASSATSRSAPSSMDSPAGPSAAPVPSTTAAPPGKFVPSRRPGGATGGPGPSSAIVAAKRAAAAKMAEMRRQEAAAAAAAAAAQAEAEAAEQDEGDGQQGEETVADARQRDDEDEQGDTSVGDSTQGASDEGDATPTKGPAPQLHSRGDDGPSSHDRLSSGMASSRFLSRRALDDGDDNDEDDTVQLGGPSSTRRQTGNEEGDDSVADFDASVTMDLMAAPMVPPSQRSRSKGAHDSLPSSSTRRASSEATAAAATPPHTSSRLPRPVSMMMMGSPSPSASRQQQQQQPNIISSLQSQSQAAASSAVPATPPTASASSASAAGAGQGWFLNRAARLNLAADGSVSSPLKSKPDSLAWVEEVRTRQADVKTFRQLAKLSGQFKVAQRGDDGGGESVRRRAATGKERLQDEVDDPSDDEDDDDDEGSNRLTAQQRQQTEAWRDGHLFELLFSALEAWFITTSSPAPSPPEASNAAAQVLLHRLVENQFALFPALGLEARLVKVVLYGLGGSGGQAAAKAILTAWATRTVPAVGLAVLRAEGERAFGATSPDSSSARLLALSGLSHLFSRLPRSLVFEDELPRVSAWVLGAMNDQGSVQARQEGVRVLVAAVRGREEGEGEGQGEEDADAVTEKLQKALGEGGLKREQVDLVLYYVAKGAGGA